MSAVISASEAREAERADYSICSDSFQISHADVRKAFGIRNSGKESRLEAVQWEPFAQLVLKLPRTGRSSGGKGIWKRRELISKS